MKISNAIQSLCIALVLSVTMTANTCWGGEPKEEKTAEDFDPLIKSSDLILLGHVENIKQGLRETYVMVGVETVFKGDKAVRSVKIRYDGGKFTVDPDAPELASYDKAIFYLVRKDGIYECQNGAFGAKKILNENVYIQPKNVFLVMKLPQYIKVLSDRILVLYPPPPNEDPKSVRRTPAS